MREVTEFSFRAKANPTWTFTPNFPHQRPPTYEKSRL